VESDTHADADARDPTELSRLTNVLALMLVRGLPQRALTQNEQILVLCRAGFRNQAIADLLGTTPQTVNVAKSADRAKKRGKRKARS
jgi:DNA-binding CsgD family transcriptional regulator